MFIFRKEIQAGIQASPSLKLACKVKQGVSHSLFKPKILCVESPTQCSGKMKMFLMSFQAEDSLTKVSQLRGSPLILLSYFEQDYAIIFGYLSYQFNNSFPYSQFKILLHSNCVCTTVVTFPLGRLVPGDTLIN